MYKFDILTLVIEKSRTSQQDAPPIAFLEKPIPYIYELLTIKKRSDLEGSTSAALLEAFSNKVHLFIIQHKDRFFRKFKFRIS